jgi:biopolymer transport protein ExbD
MRLTSRETRHSSAIELQMTSMIDVVFLLLIFFMVTSSWQKTERQLEPGIQVQRSGAGQRGQLEPAIVDIVRGDEGFVFQLGGRQFRSADELTPVLSQFENKTDGAFVRAVNNAPFEMAASAIQACKSARFPNVLYVPLAE